MTKTFYVPQVGDLLLRKAFLANRPVSYSYKIIVKVDVMELSKTSPSTLAYKITFLELNADKPKVISAPYMRLEEFHQYWHVLDGTNSESYSGVLQELDTTSKCSSGD